MFRGIGSTKDRDSSDEEDNRSLTDWESQGLLRFPVYCVKSQRNKELYVDLPRAIIYQRSQKDTKTIRCKHIQKMVVDLSTNQAIIDIKRNTTRQKVFNFELGQATKFQEMIEFCKVEGDNCRYIFNIIDKTKAKVISRENLGKILKELEIPASEDEVEVM